VPALRHTIGGRYRVVEQLGRGGMAVVYRVHDAGSGAELALKQLLVPESGARAAQAVSLFEREFYILAQLAHPRVIAVYDYGIDAAGPFYTMELLDGGDLKALAPMPVPRACLLMLEVCSSLALLHSRRFVHRDITPRNIRCTRDGHAKLIDFGAMVPMGPCSHTVGTPAFVAPEVVHHASLDARTDLFSLGATLYYTLTGQPPFSARHLSELRDAYRHEVIPPSRLVPDIPPALDALCASLLRIDPGQRPRSVFEVMHRLEAIAGVEHSEPVGVSQAYLATPLLCGRDAELRVFRQRMRRALHGAGGALLLQSAPGLGRSRMLDACVLEGKTLGATVLRVDAGASAGTPFAAVEHLCEQLLQALPDAASAAAERAGVRATLFARASESDAAPVPLRAFGDPAIDRGALQAALGAWLARVCDTHALLIAVDDVQRLDEPSIAWLAALALEAPELRLLVVATAEPAAADDVLPALSVLARHATIIDLAPLSRTQTEALLASVFGNVPDLPLLADRLHDIALGSPRETLVLAQHLVDAGVVRYHDGQWTLPAELEPADLPASAAEALAARVAALPPLARRLAQAQALLGTHALRREDYAALAPESAGTEIDAAILALLRSELVQSDGELHSLSHRTLVDMLCASLDGGETRERHLALYELHRRRGDAHPYQLAQHLLAAGHHDQALDLLAGSVDLLDQQGVDGALRFDVRRLAAMLEHALELTATLGRAAREGHELRRRLCAFAVVCDDAIHRRVAPEWLAQLERDSGLCDYRALDASLDPGVRLQQALGAAAARHAAAPERERAYRVDEAIKHLAVYVVTSIVVGTRTLDMPLIASLPGLLEPFAALSPALHAIWQNVVALNETTVLGRRKRSARRSRDVYEHLSRLKGDEVRYVDSVRHAVANTIGWYEASLGRLAALEWAELLDKDPLQRVMAMDIRRATCLMKGDAEGAERYRKQGELLALRASARQMFEKPWPFDLEIGVLTGDLAGIKRVIDGIAPLAERYPAWVALLRAAEGHFNLLRGDFESARAAFEQGIALSDPQQREPPPQIHVYAQAVAGAVTALAELGRCEAAIELGERALATCDARGAEICWYKVARALALAEARGGRLPRATARIEALIETERQDGVSGLSAAASYEARARIAIWARDADTAARYAALAVRERGGRSASASAPQVVRLLEEARGFGLDFELEPTDFEVSVLGASRSAVDPLGAPMIEALAGCETGEQRAARTLELLCGLAHSAGGHLYLVGADRELVLAATRNAPPPSAEAARFARGFFAQQLDDAQMTEGLTQATHMLSLPGAGAYIDSDRAEHHLFVLSCKQQGELVYVGLAVVAASKNQRVDPEAMVYSAGLAAALLRAADTSGIRSDAVPC
jgi:hypothetical protein